MARLLLLCAVAASTSAGWDVLYYDQPLSVLPSMQTDGDIALGFFSSNAYWAPDSSGDSQEYEISPALSVIRVHASGRYGITSSHSIGVIIPAYIQVSGPSDSTGGGVSDPWITFDGWIERTPMVIGHLALRIPLKGALESGDYTEGDPHLAFDGALSVESPLSGPGVSLRATAGLRYSLAAWSADPRSPRDSLETQPPVEIRGNGFLVLKANPQLSLRAGGEFAARGDVKAEVDGDWETLDDTARNSIDFRAGFDLEGQGMSLSADLYYRLSGSNVNKEWGLMVSGLGLDFTDLFGAGGGSR